MEPAAAAPSRGWLALGAAAAAAAVAAAWLRSAGEAPSGDPPSGGLDALQAALAASEAALATSEAARRKAEALRQEERTGRTRAEQRIREVCQNLPAGADVTSAKSQRRSTKLVPSRASRRRKPLPTFSYQAIGEIQSCFVERNGCPRQPAIAPSSRAWLQLRGDINPAGCTDGLAEYTHLQIIFVFHANTNMDKTATTAGGATASRFKAKVAPPRLGGSRKVGTLATRSPHRPNPIGLSTARIAGVDPKSGRVLLSGVDLLDGTPVLDIKPYIPEYDSVPEATVPNWVDEPMSAAAMAAVRWAEGARDRLQGACARTQALRVLPDAAAVAAVAEEVLAWDVRSNTKRKRHQQASSAENGDSTDAHKIRLDGLEIHFRVLAEKVVEIIDAVAVRGKPSARPAQSTKPADAPAAKGAASTAAKAEPEESTALVRLREGPAAAAAAVAARGEGPMRWLVLGDGDFSFSLSLATSCGCSSDSGGGAGMSWGWDGVGLVATSLDSEADLVKKYGPAVLETLAALREAGATVLHGVDATSLPATLLPQLDEPDAEFDRIQFQFPLCGATADKAEFEAAAVPAELRNRHLIDATLHGAAQLLRPSGELIITAKSDNKYDMRFFCGPAPPSAAAAPAPGSNGERPPLLFAGQWAFEIAEFPGYTPRNVETNESFPIAGSISYAFVHKPRLPEFGGGAPAAAGTEQRWFCGACGVQCSGEKAWTDHVGGVKHRRSTALERKWEAFKERGRTGSIKA